MVFSNYTLNNFSIPAANKYDSEVSGNPDYKKKKT